MFTMNLKSLQVLSAESWVLTREELVSKWIDIINIRAYGNALNYL